MFRVVPTSLVFLTLWTISSIGGAAARDLLQESSPNSDLTYSGRPQYSPPDSTEGQVVAGLQSSVDADSLGAARAQYVPPPNAIQRPASIPPQYFAVNSSFDADSLGNRSVYVDSTAAPLGIYQTGIRFRASGVASWYNFLASDNPRQIASGHYLEGGLLVGYGLWVPGFNINLYVGPAFGEGVNEGVVTDRWGVKAVLETYATPTQLTMLSSSVTYSTIGNNLQVQGKAGVKIVGDIYFGPETKFNWQKLLPWQIDLFSGAIATATPVSAQDTISYVRVGAHVSAVRLGPAFFSVSGGWAHDRQLGSGYYGSVSLYQPF